MSFDMSLNFIRRKRWICVAFLIMGIGSLLAAALLLFLLQKQLDTNQSLLLASALQFQDLDPLIIKPKPQGLRTVTWDRHQRGPHLYNSVEHDKTNGTSTSPYSEEFTIIMLTNHNRILDLPKTLENLRGLQGLKRVIVIWNGEKPESGIDTGVLPFPVQVLTNGRNSLNNRFLPLEIIETDAILSMDDDMFPSQESIIFAFRVWQEFPERIVGFPGRGVIWSEGGWKYDPHPCSISMVLTGLAFFHKKYLDLYTHEMPPAIRERVDNVTNCEDIAMNFLVSHLTQKPPIKVTPTNAWVCPGCDSTEKGKNALWKDPKHFEERDSCINYFAQIYGYTPLFKSQYRIDDNFDGSRNAACGRNISNPRRSPIISALLVCFCLILCTGILLYYCISTRLRHNPLR